VHQEAPATANEQEANEGNEKNFVFHEEFFCKCQETKEVKKQKSNAKNGLSPF